MGVFMLAKEIISHRSPLTSSTSAFHLTPLLLLEGSGGLFLRLSTSLQQLLHRIWPDALRSLLTM